MKIKIKPMFNFLKRGRIRKSIEKLDRQHVFLNFNSINHILIFFDISDKEEVKIITDNLSSEGKTVSTWTYSHSKAHKENKNTLHHHVITKKDISIMGNINDKLYNDFANTKYDTIIDLTKEDHYPLLYLLANNKARLTIGTRETHYKLYDFIFLKNDDMSISQSFFEIKNYLLKIPASTNNL